MAAVEAVDEAAVAGVVASSASAKLKARVASWREMDRTPTMTIGVTEMVVVVVGGEVEAAGEADVGGDVEVVDDDEAVDGKLDGLEAREVYGVDEDRSASVDVEGEKETGMFDSAVGGSCGRAAIAPRTSRGANR